MSTQSAKWWKKVERAELLRAIRVWCFALGGVILTLALCMLISGGGIVNPKAASSIYVAFEASGMLHEFAAATAVVGLGFLAVGLLAGFVAFVAGRDHES